MLSPALIVMVAGLYAKFWMFTARAAAAGEATAMFDPMRSRANAPKASRMARTPSRIRYE